MSYHRLRKTAADSLRGFLPYTAYEIGNEEYLGTYDGSKDELVDRLKERGYHYQLFAAEKQLNDSTDDGSWARIASRHPDAVSETALEQVDPRNCQYHVHCFEMDDGVEIYGHYEIHPYPWIPTWDLTRPYPKHYRPMWDTRSNPKSEWTYLRGVCDSRLQPLFKQ